MLRSAAVLLGTSLVLSLGASAGAAGERDGAPMAADAEAQADDLEVGWRALGRTEPFGVETPPARSRALAVGLRAGVAHSPGERQRVFGVLELNIGLDDWLGGRAERADELATSDDGAAGDVDLEPEAARAGLALAAQSAGSDAPPEPRPGLPLATPAAPDASGGLARDAVRGEPAPPPAPTRHEIGLAPGRDALETARLARALVAEARRVQGSAAELRRLDGMASRSRAAAGLPEVRLGAGTASDESLRLTPTVSDPARFTRDGGRDVWLEARLTWRLDSAIFARDEIAIMRLRAQRQEESSRLARDVIEALVEWRKATLVQHSPLALPEERDAASIRQFGAVARLDVLTDGWFSRYLERWGPSAGSSRWP
jgi:hypothetical protein